MKSYDREKLQSIINNCNSKVKVLKELGLRMTGGNYNTLNNLIKKYNLDISHFKGSGWRKGKKGTDDVCSFKLNDILQNETSYKSSSLLKRLISNQIKEYKCENCGISEWNNKPISLELHHIDGNHNNNSIDNLQILCPNCHSQTFNYRGRNVKKTGNNSKGFKQFYDKELPICTCKNCGKEFKSDRYDRKRSFCCRECYNQYLRKNISENKRENKSIIYNPKFTIDELKGQCDMCNSISQIAINLNSHRETIRRYLIYFDLYNNFKNKIKAN